MYPSINIGQISIPTYGLCAAVGMLSAFLLLLYTHKRRELNKDAAFTCSFVAIISGLIGSKLLYFIVELPAIISNPSFLKDALTGGFVFYGGLIGGIIGGWIYCAVKKLPVLAVADAYAAPLTLGQAFGRIGCFMAGCCYGMRCDSPLCVVFPSGSAAPAGVPLLPTQLMEAAFLFVLTAALVLILKRVKLRGIVTGVYLIAYGVWRFIIEFFRDDYRGGIGALSTSQIISLVLVPVGIAIIVAVCVRNKTAES